MSIQDLLSPFLFLTFLLRCHHCRETDVSDDAAAEFSVRLYQQLQAGGEQDNIIFSPLSVAVALGMVGLGARGVSLDQIRQIAGFSPLLSGETFLEMILTFTMTTVCDVPEAGAVHHLS